MVLLKGRMRMRIGDETLELSKGDYVAIQNNIPDKIEEIIEEATIVGVRYPSIPNNKILLEE